MGNFANRRVAFRFPRAAFQRKKGADPAPKRRGQIGPVHALGYECLTICTVETTCGTLAICMASHLPPWSAPALYAGGERSTVEKS